MQWREKFGKAFLIVASIVFFSVSLAPLALPEKARAAGAAVKVWRKDIVAKLVTNNELHVSFIATPCVDGTFSNNCGSPTGNIVGSLTAYYEKDTGSVTFDPGSSTSLPKVTASKARVFKPDKSSFKPARVEVFGEGLTAPDESWKPWSQLRILIANKSDLTFGKPDEGPLLSYFMEVSGNSYVSIGASLQRTSQYGIQDSVQESLARNYNYSGPDHGGFVVPISGEGTEAGTKLDREAALNLMNQYKIDNVILVEENPAGKEKPPVTNFLSKDVNEKLQLLTFTFNSIFNVGGQLGDDNHFFWFKANNYPNLWVLIDEDGDAELLLADVSSAERPEEGVLKGSLSAGGSFGAGDRDNPDGKGTFTRFVLSRVINKCASALDCTNNNFSQIIDFPSANGDISVKSEFYNNSVAHTGNGKNVKPWIGVWGVTYSNVQSAGDVTGSGCSIPWIIYGNEGAVGAVVSTVAGSGPSWLGEFNINSADTNVFTRGMLCVYDWVVRPAVKWATQLIEYAAGVAHNTNTRSHHLSALAWRPNV